MALNPSTQDKRLTHLANYDGTFQGIYPLGNKPSNVPTFDKIIDPTTANADRFTGVTAGMRVGLTDGVYSAFLAGEIPDGVALEAVNHGAVTISGGEADWTAVMLLDGNNKELNGLRIGNPSFINSHACQVSGSNHIIKNTGFFNGGNHKHHIPLMIGGTGHLIEDSWAWGEGRYTIQALGASSITLRRVLARWDETIAGYPTEPNAALCFYSTNDSIMENCISLDYGTPEDPMSFGGDIYSPQHTATGPNVSNNQFLGNMVVNHAATTSNRRAFRLDPDTASTGIVLDDLYVRGNGTAIVVKPNCTIEYKKITVIDSAMGTVNTGSAVEVVPTGAADIDFRYQDGVKTATPLWPWPNEARIIADLTGADQKRSANPADTTWQSSSNLGYSAFIVECGTNGKTIEQYVKGL